MTQSPGGRKPLMDDAEWYASLPGFPASGAALLTDAAGAVLLVKPWYRDHWLLPGGVTEAGESPRQCAEREAAEEIGVAVTATALLAVHWMPPACRAGRPSHSSSTAAPWPAGMRCTCRPRN